jgi:phosphatidate cytidylyltransferase
MRRIITSLIIVPFFLIAILWSYGPWFAAVVAGLFFVLGRAELYSLMGIPPKRSLYIWQNLLALLFLFLTVQPRVPSLIALAFLFYWGSCAITLRFPVKGCRNEISTHGLSLVYLLFPLACYVYLRTFPYGPAYLFFMIAVAIFTDVGAYYGGKTFGRNKLAPEISPNKTWEGSVIGTLSACLIFMGVVALQSLWQGVSLWIPEPHQYLHILGVTIIMSIIGQVGDLFESAMKRDAGIKDSGSQLTGHGGFLDMMDAMLWIGPAMLVYVKLFTPE